MDRTIIEIFQSEVDREIADLTDDIVSGIPDQQHYHKIVGIIRGLRLAAEILKETQKKIMDE